MKAAAAKNALTGVGLTIRVSVVTGDYTEGRVVRQRPVANTLVEPGATVRIVIGPAALAGQSGNG